MCFQKEEVNKRHVFRFWKEGEDREKQGVEFLIRSAHSFEIHGYEDGELKSKKIVNLHKGTVENYSLIQGQLKMESLEQKGFLFRYNQKEVQISLRFLEEFKLKAINYTISNNA